MGEDRRRFLKLAGLTALCAAGKGSLVRPAGAETPAPGGAAEKKVRWAMVIDPRKCLEKEGCTACIDACNRAHNVPAFDDHKHEVKWIWKERFADAFPDQEATYADPALTAKPVLVFCNHCDNPPCVRVCPTQATWKREDGIVMMDWHRCIGCRYCMAACPYGSRSFNWEDPRPHIKELNPDFPTRTKGVVEKCTFCDELVDKGKLPACVTACNEKALTFGDLNDPDSEVRRLLRSRFALRRKAGLGTNPELFYLV
jgi:Fe-S-cluster-containing dehydrogenase component